MTRSKRGKKRERNITTTSSVCFKLISYAKDVFKILLNSFFTELGQLNNTQLNIMSQSHVMCRFKRKKTLPLEEAASIDVPFSTPILLSNCFLVVPVC